MAQAACLEEMLQTPVPNGALFYGKTKHRLDVTFDDAVRMRLKQIVADLRAMLAAGKTPAAAFEKKCESCSLIDLCMPQMSEKHRSVSEYMREMTRG
jgi:CRISPR-associated exonuclease Cas4